MTITPKTPVLVSTPESSALAGAGATGCAWGSQMCSGNIPALVPKPSAIISARPRERLEVQSEKILELDQEQFEWQNRLRLVPYRGVNKGTAFMLAIKPDRVEVTMDGTTYETTKVLIGLDGRALSSDGKYQAIIHPELVQEAASALSTAPSAEATEKPLNVV